MKASIFVATATLFIVASALPSTAQDRSGGWSPPIKLGPAINSDSIKEGPAVSKEEEAEEHNRCPQRRFGEFSDWAEPVWLGPIVNSSANDFHPAISHNGLSLYISSNRAGGFGLDDIWVSQRANLDDPWGPPQNLGPNINTAGDEFAPDFAPDGHWLFFSSGRPPGTTDAPEIWASYRKDVDDDFGWGPAVKLPGDINVPGLDDNAPIFFHDHNTGITSIYFNSINRKDGPGDFDIYVSTQRENGTFGPARVVRELDSPQRDTRTAIRSDGLEMFVTSNRPGGFGLIDLWVATRGTTLDRWSTPVNLGSTINTQYDDGGPALSCDGTTLYFYSSRPGGSGGRDLYVTTRHKLHF
jgi:Tol biopolymer transport system component